MNLFKNTLLLFFCLLCLTLNVNAIYRNSDKRQFLEVFFSKNLTFFIYRCFFHDDQYGLDDWHVQSVGKIKRAISSEQENSKKISQNFYVLSTSNILASISARNSELQWRNVESDNLIDFLKIQNYLFVVGETSFMIYDISLANI